MQSRLCSWQQRALQQLLFCMGLLGAAFGRNSPLYFRRTSLSGPPLEKVKEAGSGINLDAYAGDNTGTIKAQTMQALQPPSEASNVPFFVVRLPDTMTACA